MVEAGSSSSSAASHTNALSVSVSKPEHQGSGRLKVTEYLVTTTFPNGAESLVRRPFDDFQWLEQRLKEERAGIIVPALPHTKPLNVKQKFADDFVHQRLIVLDRFLQRIRQHTELVDAPSLLPFFTFNPADWKVAKQKQRDALKNSDSSDTLSEHDYNNNNNNNDDPNSIVIHAEAPPDTTTKHQPLRNWFSSKKDQWALRNPKLMLEETPSEAKKYQELQEYADHLETCARILSEDYKVLLGSIQTHAEKVQTMGAAFTQLWGDKQELSTTSTSTMYQTVGDCWASLSTIVQHQYAHGVHHFDTPLEELVLDVIALKHTLAKRKKIVYDYTKKKQAGRKMQIEMEKLKMVNDLSRHQDKYWQLEKDIRLNDVQEKDLQQFCELISSRLDRDIVRFRVEWHERMRHVLEGYHIAQIKFLEKQTKQYLRALPTLQQMDSNRANLPTSATRVVNPDLMVSYTTTGAKASFGGDGAGAVDSLSAMKSFDSISLESLEVTANNPFEEDNEPPLVDLLDDIPTTNGAEASAPASAPPPPPPESPQSAPAEESSEGPKLLSV